MAAEALAGVDERARRAGDVHERGQVLAGHDRHAEERGFAHGLAQAVDQLADLAAVVGRGDHRAPAGAGAGAVAVDVGDLVAVGELQGGVLLEELDHARAGFEEGVDARGVVPVAQLVLEVGARQLGVFDDAGAARQRVARHPHPAAGPGGGAAEHRVLLHHHDLLAVPGGGHRGRQAGGAGADDQDIAFERRGQGTCRHRGSPRGRLGEEGLVSAYRCFLELGSNNTIWVSARQVRTAASDGKNVRGAKTSGPGRVPGPGWLRGIRAWRCRRCPARSRSPWPCTSTRW
ncbi:hypothetical protein D3C78_840970 [compost metagenome]